MGEKIDVAALLAQMQKMEQEMQQMRNAQNQQVATIGGTDLPHTFYKERSPIVVPTLTRTSYEIKPQLITLVEQRPFNGLAHENPIDHIDRFEKICGTSHVDGVPHDYNHCKLFEFSLADKAIAWLNSLPPKSLNGWEEIRAAFLDHYYTKAKTATLKAKLANFQQASGESFCEAWERFKSYRRDCPHHGYTEGQLLTIFYEGVNWDFKAALNASSKGNFMTQTVEGANELIANLAESYRDKNVEYDRSCKVNSIDAQKIDDIHNMLLKVTKKSVSFADVNAIHDKEEKDVAYVGNFGQNFQSGQYNKPFNSGYQRPIGEGRSYGNTSYHSPKAQDNETKSMFEQILEGQQKLTVSFNGKLDHLYTDLNTKVSNVNEKIEQLAIHLKKTDLQVAQTAEAVRRQEGFLPAKTDQNPKQFVNAISVESAKEEVDLLEAMLRSDEYEGDFKWVEEDENSATKQSRVDRHSSNVVRHNAGKTESYSVSAAGVDRHHEQYRSTTPNVDVHTAVVSSSSRYTLDTDRETTQKSRVSIDTRSDVDRHPPHNQPSASSSPSNPVDQVSTTSERVYQPKMSYPAVIKSEKEREKEIEARRQAILRNVIKESPSYSFIKNSPVIKGFIKQLSVSNISIEDGVQSVLKEVHALNVSLMKISKKETSPPTLTKLDKMKSPGRFVFDCSIKGVKMKDALCDTGATVNVMSHAVARRLGLSCQQTSTTPIILADSSTVHAKGYVPDVMLRIGECLVPADFYIMDINEDINRPLILGSSFLATVGAVMDFPNQRVSFSKINKTVFYHFSSMSGTACKAIIHDEKTTSVLQDIPKEVKPVIKDAPNIDKTAKVERNRTSKPFATISIVIPLELTDMGDDVIKDKLKGTMNLFPHFSSWQVKGAVLAPMGKYRRFTYDPP